MIRLLLFRGSDGRKYGDKVTTFKKSEFPYPVSGALTSPSAGEQEEMLGNTGQPQPVPVSGEIDAVRTPMSYVREISSLQAKLHSTITDLEECNSASVKISEKYLQLKSEFSEAKSTIRKLGAEKSALLRKLRLFEGEEVLPRPGPPLKPLDDLTPRQRIRATNKLQAEMIKTSEERKILPARLSAFLTYRYAWAGG